MRPVLAAVAALAILAAIAPPAVAAGSPRSSEPYSAPTRVRDVVGTMRVADQALLAGLPPETRVSLHRSTGRVRYLGGRPSRPLFVAPAFASASPAAVARAFVDRNGPLLGLARGSSDLQVERLQRTSTGRTVVRFQQRRDGIPVLGGQLTVQVGDRGEVITAMGELLPSATKVPHPDAVSAVAARDEAITVVSRDTNASPSALRATIPERWIHDPRILGGPGAPIARDVWRVDVSGSARDGQRVGRMVLVDASTGAIAASIGLVHEALERRVCDFRNVRREDFRCTSPFTRVEGQGPRGLREVDAAYRAMGDTYRFFLDRFGRDSTDGAGKPLVATVRYCRLDWCPMQNAFWDWEFRQASFGDGWASADDLVGHEYTHG